MAISHSDLESFHQFALAKLSNGGAKSLREMVSLWEAAREREEVNAAIRAGLQAIDEGRCRPYEESMAEFRAKHDLSPRP